jgi:antitoxin CcdA
MRSVQSNSRRSINLTLPASLIEQAKTLGLNLSSAAEAGVAAEVARAAHARFTEDIRRGVEQHERWITEFGLLSEQVAAMQDEAGDAG